LEKYLARWHNWDIFEVQKGYKKMKKPILRISNIYKIHLVKLVAYYLYLSEIA